MRRVSRWALAATCIVALAAGATYAAQQDSPILDEDVKLVTFEDLAYPPWAVNAKVQGVAVVKATLDSDGRVTAASGISGPKGLIPMVESNARKWRFRPNARNTAIIVYNFRIDEGACHDAAKSVFLLHHQNLATIVACTPVAVG